MKKVIINRVFKKVLLIFFCISFGLSQISYTSADFNSLGGNTVNSFDSGCWDTPTSPGINSPANDLYTDQTDISFNWSGSLSSCPIAQIKYNFQLYSDSGLTTLVTESDFLNNLSYDYINIPEGEYWWKVTAKDQYNNASDSPIGHFTIDRTAPIISNIIHFTATPENTNDTSATVTWTTNENANSKISYWDSLDPTVLTVDSASYVTNHSLKIPGLSIATYYYYVTSTDSAGNTTTSTTNSFDTIDTTPEDITPTTDIVLNEFLIDPIGADDASMTGGEWVELYNNSTTTSYDLTGWSINAANTPAYRLYLSTTNTISSNPATSGLTIGPNEFFVIYRNGDASFYLKNDSDDGIRLYDSTDTLADQYMYTLSQIVENKSIARYPDGSSTWFDPIPSPLTFNVLEDWQLAQPEIFYTRTDQKLSFEIKNIEKFTQIEYELTYNSDSGSQGVIGSSDLYNQASYKKDDLIFGTCSTGGTCVYHANLNNILLKIILKNGSEIKNLEKIIE